MKKLCFDLLKKWCDALVKLQITEIDLRGIHGGIMCPACSRIHGRCADAVYPLMYMAHATGDQRYLDAAIRLREWSDHVTFPDGSWVNEPSGAEWTWKGITVFGAVALGEALRRHGDILPADVRSRWMDRLARATEFLYGFMTMSLTHINYPVTCSATMVVAGKVLDEPRYTARGRELAHNALSYFSQDNRILFGEGVPQDGKTPRGCRPIDLGYNVEESLPSLVLYGLIESDEEVLGVVTESLKSHLEFMLPDGAWDNSWASRNYKWTYWGSRTSDGCQGAYALLADRDPCFAEAAVRNTRLLAECTHEGILYGGPHYVRHGELPCIHHTFCHAKALATVLDHIDIVEKAAPSCEVPLPRQKASGIRYFSEMATWLAAIGHWRATVTANDWEHTKGAHASGGALTMLWHETTGPILVASMTEYLLMEPSNVQPHRDDVWMPLTPRLEWQCDGNYYRNINDLTAEVNCEQTEDQLIFTTKGYMVDKNQDNPNPGKIPFQISYRFTANDVEILVDPQDDCPVDSLEFFLPVISPNNEKIKCSADGCVDIIKGNARVNISTNVSSGLRGHDEPRVFNHVPGFEAVPLSVRWIPEKDEQLRIKIVVQDNK